MQLTPYEKLITMTKDAVNAALAPIRAAKQKKRAELEVLKLEEKKQSLEAEIIELCQKKDLDFDCIIDKQDEYALVERRLAQFDKVIKELFPAE